MELPKPRTKFVVYCVSGTLAGLPLSIELSRAQIGNLKFYPAIEQPSALLPSDDHTEQSSDNSQVKLAWEPAAVTTTAYRSSGFQFDDQGDGHVVLQKRFLLAGGGRAPLPSRS